MPISKTESNKQIIFLFVALTVLLAAASGFLYYSLGQTRNGYETLDRETTKLDLLLDMRGTMGDAQILILRYILSGDTVERERVAESIRGNFVLNSQRLAEIENYLLYSGQVEKENIWIAERYC